MRRLLLFFLLIFAVCARAETPSQIPNPLETNRSWVADVAQVLSEGEEKQINAILSPLERQTGAEIAVVTVRNLSGQDIESWADELFNSWRIGKKGKDNGILLVAAIDERNSHIEIGYGLEDEITDAQSAVIAREQLRPAFKRGDYGAGVLGVVKSLDSKIRGVNFGANSGSNSNPQTQPPVQTQPRIPQPQIQNPPLQKPAPQLPFGLILLSFGAVAGIGGLIYASSRPPKCVRCETELTQLSEAQEDPFLSEEQKFEEDLGAVDWQVWNCPKCNAKRITPQEKFFSTYHRCRRCANRTARQERFVLQYPTYTFPGVEEIREICEWPRCRHQSRHQRSIPRKVHSTSSGGFVGGFGGGFSPGGSGRSSGSSGDSGPSSFGGGESGGAGSSTSW